MPIFEGMGFIERAHDLKNVFFCHFLFVIWVFSGIMLFLKKPLGGYGHRFENKIPSLLEGSA